MHRQVEIAIEERHIARRIGADIQHGLHAYTGVQAFHQVVIHREGKRELPVPVADSTHIVSFSRRIFRVIITMHTQFIITERGIRIEENALVLWKDKAETIAKIEGIIECIIIYKPFPGVLIAFRIHLQVMRESDAPAQQHAVHPPLRRKRSGKQTKQKHPPFHTQYTF